MTKFFNVTVKVFLLLILVVVAGEEAKAAGDDGIRIGVTIYADERRNGITEGDAQIMTNMLTNALAGTRNIRIYERRQLDAAIREISRGSSVAMDENTIVELGKLSGLQYVLTGSIDSLGRTVHSNSLIIIRGSHTTIEEKYEISIRMLDVATGEVRLAFSEEGNAKEAYVNTSWISTRETGGLKTQAIRNAMSRLTGRLRNALAAEFTFSQPNPPLTREYYIPREQQEQPIPTVSSQTLQPQRSDFNPNVSDKAEVIRTYPITPGQANLLIIGHNTAFNQYSRGNFKAAYETFCRLADDYGGNYLAAYWAGESARKLKKNSEAISWYDRALSINPDYEPARKARTQMN